MLLSILTLFIVFQLKDIKSTYSCLKLSSMYFKWICYCQDADCRAEILKGEKEEILAKLSHSEKVQSEWRSRVSKLEEENAKLRRALEQSMTRLNRMSVDSDFLVDRSACFFF